MPGYSNFLTKGIAKVFGRGAVKGTKVAAEGAKIFTRPVKLGMLGGATSFFGFEWLTHSGLVRAVGGTLGIDNNAASILVTGTVVAVVAVIIYGLYKHITKGTSSGSRGGRK